MTAKHECDPDHVALILAIEDGEFDRASEILARDSQNRYVHPLGALQVTALQVAAWQGRIDLLDQLYEKGASVNDVDKIGRCALYYAAHRGSIDVTEWLLRHGGCVDAKVGVYSCTKGSPDTSLASCFVGRKVRISKRIVESFIELDFKNFILAFLFPFVVSVAVARVLGEDTLARGGEE